MNIQKKFFFLSGLPRSGSTLLASILNQHPEIYATPTSPMLDLLYLNEQAWRQNPSVVANKFEQQVVSLSEAIINGCWKHIDKPIIIDKHRAWAKQTPIIQHFFGEAKIIVTARDIPSILSSFLRLIRTNSNNFVDNVLRSRRMTTSDTNRCDLLLHEYVADPYNSFKTGFIQSRSNLLILEYDDIVSTPDIVMQKIYSFLNLQEYSHDYNKIENITNDNDLAAWGLNNLHTIRPKLEKTCNSARDVLGSTLFNKYNSMNLEFWR